MGERVQQRATAPLDADAYGAMTRLAARAPAAAAPEGAASNQQLWMTFDWLYGVCKDERLEEASFLLATRLLTQSLAARSVPIRNLQLTAAVSLSLASKVTDVHPPSLSDLAQLYTTDPASRIFTYSMRQAMAEEWAVLRSLNFRALVPTPLEYLTRFEALGPPEVYTGARYACLVSVFARETHAMRVDSVAAACYWLATQRLGREWTPDRKSVV